MHNMYIHILLVAYLLPYLFNLILSLVAFRTQQKGAITYNQIFNYTIILNIITILSSHFFFKAVEQTAVFGQN